MNKNFIEVKSILQNMPTTIFKGSALEIIEQKSKLDNIKVSFRIEPQFPY